MRIIDLTVALSEETPVYPGGPNAKIETEFIEDIGCRASSLRIGAHDGTHMDAPLHFVENGKTLAEYPAEKFVCRGVLIDVTGKKEIRREDLQGDIREGDFLILKTGQGLNFENCPVLAEDAMDYMIEKKISIFGWDSTNFGGDFPAQHRKLLGADILIVESLTNLENITGKEFKVIALPMKVKGAEAAPCRIIVIEDSSIEF